MPSPAHTRLTFSGTFGPDGAAVEEWSFNINTGDNVFADLAARVATATALRAAWVARIAFMQSNTVRLTRVRVAQIGNDGLVTKNAGGEYNQGDSLGNNAGEQSTASFFPSHVALCVSLVTARPGPTGKGRFYLPAPPTPLLATTLAWNPTDVTTWTGRVTSFLNDIDAAIVGQGGTSGNIVVASSKGYLTTVTRARIGSVPDTQRRRRRSLPEAYVEGALLNV